MLSCAVLCCPVLSCAVSSSVWESVCQCLCPMEMCQMGTRPHAHPLRGEGSGLSLRNNHVGRALAWPYFLPCRIDTEGFWVGTSLHVFMLRWTLGIVCCVFVCFFVACCSALEKVSTTHYSVSDASHNIVAWTTTIEGTVTAHPSLHTYIHSYINLWWTWQGVVQVHCSSDNSAFSCG